MDSFISKAGRTKPPEPLPPHKRISTPAGQRLSVILENHDAARQQSSRNSFRSSLKKPIIGPTPRESSENSINAFIYGGREHGSPPPPYTEKLLGWRNNRHLAKRGGWRRLALILGVVLLVVIGVVVGVVVATTKKASSNSSSNSSSPDPNNSVDSTNPTTAANANPTAPAGPSPTAAGPSSSSTSAPSNFPLGSWSLLTFLDTIQTTCTANAATWPCYPYTIYNDSPTQSLTSFQWIISSSSPSSASKNSYRISSTDNPFTIPFSDIPLRLYDEGKPTENLRFQISVSREVAPREAITDDGAAATCFYNSTTFQAYLYTKMKRDYPSASASTSAGGAFAEWPYAVRVEQIAGGGEDVPDCYRLENGRVGEGIAEGLEAMEAGSLCSCLYRNYFTRIG